MQGIQSTIKVTPTASQQAAIISALQSQTQRQNASPVRLQTTAGGSLVAVVQQQSGAETGPTSGQIIAQPQQIQLTPQQSLQQQQQQQQVTDHCYILKEKVYSKKIFFCSSSNSREISKMSVMNLKQDGFESFIVFKHVFVLNLVLQFIDNILL